MGSEMCIRDSAKTRRYDTPPHLPALDESTRASCLESNRIFTRHRKIALRLCLHEKKQRAVEQRRLFVAIDPVGKPLCAVCSCPLLRGHPQIGSSSHLLSRPHEISAHIHHVSEKSWIDTTRTDRRLGVIMVATAHIQTVVLYRVTITIHHPHHHPSPVMMIHVLLHRKETCSTSAAPHLVPKRATLVTRIVPVDIHKEAETATGPVATTIGEKMIDHSISTTKLAVLPHLHLPQTIRALGEDQGLSSLVANPIAELGVVVGEAGGEAATYQSAPVIVNSFAQSESPHQSNCKA